MKILKLMHPKIGLVAQEKLGAGKGKYTIEKKWKYRYGQKYKECYVEIEGELKGMRRRVINCKTGDIYENQEEAAQKLKVGQSTINTHLNRMLKVGADYLVRFE